MRSSGLGSVQFRLTSTAAVRMAADALLRCTSAAGVYVMSLGSILLIILVLILIGALPTWPHSASWGYYPSGGLGIILVIVVVLVILGRI